MAWSLVRKNSTYPSASTTLPSNSSGNLLIAVTSVGATVDPTIGDTAVNSWTPLPVLQQSIGTSVSLKIFYCLSCNASAGTNTFTFSSASDQGAAVFEYSSLGAAFDTSKTASGFTSTTTPTTGSFSIAGNDLIFLAFADEATAQTTITAGTIFGSTGTVEEVQAGHVDAQEDLMNVSAATGTASITLGNATSSCVLYAVAFKESAPAAPIFMLCR